MCWLLGIRSPEQLRSHPLRGAIFETWVVSEIAKQQANRGETTKGLSFYRDQNGAEVDLIVHDPSCFTLIEAKSTATASSNLLAGIKRVHRHLAGSSDSYPAIVVYGGKQPQYRSKASIIPWRELHKHNFVSVWASGVPVKGADILALFPNNTWKRATTDDHGVGILSLYCSSLPMTVYAAVEGFCGHVQRDWLPAEGRLNVNLTKLVDGGAVIFPKGAGHLLSLNGRLNPILDNQERTCLYA